MSLWAASVHQQRLCVSLPGHASRNRRSSSNLTVSAARDRPNVATPLGVQRARPSLQLDGTKIIALVGCHADHVVRRQHHCQRCKRGQLLPRMLCGSTTAFRFGGLPCESRGSQVVPPDAAQTGAIVTPNAVRKHRVPLRKKNS